MGIELPPELSGVAAQAGVVWPEADEEAMARQAQAWREAATGMSTVTTDADTTVRGALAEVRGDTGSAASQHWQTFVEPDSGHLTATVRGMGDAADRLEHASQQVGAAKVEIVRNLVALAQNSDAAHSAAAAGHPTALAGLDTAIRGTSANVANIESSLVSAVQPASGVDIAAVRDPVNANPGTHGPAALVTDLVGNTSQGATGEGRGLVAETARGATDLVGNAAQGATNLVADTAQGATGDGRGLVAETARGATNLVADTAQGVTGDGRGLVAETTRGATNLVADTAHGFAGDGGRGPGAGLVPGMAQGATNLVADTAHAVAGPGDHGGGPNLVGDTGHAVAGTADRVAGANPVADLVRVDPDTTGPIPIDIPGEDRPTPPTGETVQAGFAGVDVPAAANPAANLPPGTPIVGGGPAPGANPAGPAPSFGGGPSFGGAPSVPGAPAPGGVVGGVAPGAGAGRLGVPGALAPGTPGSTGPGAPGPGAAGRPGLGAPGAVPGSAPGGATGAPGAAGPGRAGLGSPGVVPGAPGPGVPGSGAPGPGVPGSGVPGAGAPGAGGPGAPGTAAPGAGVPGATRPADGFLADPRKGAYGALPPAPQAAAMPAAPVRARDEELALFWVHMFPIGHMPVADHRPARQLPAPPAELDYAAGLRFEPGDHPRYDLVDSAERRAALREGVPPLEPSEPLPADAPEVTALAAGHDPLGGENERDWDRRYLVRFGSVTPHGISREGVEFAWPPGEQYPEGGSAEADAEVLDEGTELDRFGRWDGRVFAAAGTPFAQRSLPPAHLEQGYRRYRVLRPLPVWRAVSAAWFAQQGGGVRYRTTHSAMELVALGYLADVTGTTDTTDTTEAPGTTKEDT